MSHTVLAVVGDVLVRLFGQNLQQLQLNSHCVWLLLFVAIEELKLEIRCQYDIVTPSYTQI